MNSGVGMSDAIQARPEGMTIEATGLTKRYGSRQVLSGVRLSVAAGETVALIGPSGGGKSTLLRCLNGLNSFDAGEVRVGPHVLTRGTPARRRRPWRRCVGCWA